MLIDVRIVKHGPTKSVTGEYNEVFLGNRTPVSGVRVSNNNKETPARTPTLAQGTYSSRLLSYEQLGNLHRMLSFWFSSLQEMEK